MHRLRAYPAVRPPRVAPAGRDRRSSPPGGLYFFLLPAQLSLGPGVIFPIVAVLGVLPLTVRARRLGRERPWRRPARAGTLLAFTVGANGTSLALLVHELIDKELRHERGGEQLLAGGVSLDCEPAAVRGLVLGARPRRPGAEREPRRRDADFLFPQMSDGQGDRRLEARFSRLPVHVAHQPDGVQPDRSAMPLRRDCQAADVDAVALLVRARRARHRARGQHPALIRSRRGESSRWRSVPAPGALSASAPLRGPRRARAARRGRMARAHHPRCHRGVERPSSRTRTRSESSPRCKATETCLAPACRTTLESSSLVQRRTRDRSARACPRSRRAGARTGALGCGAAAWPIAAASPASSSR